MQFCRIPLPDGNGLFASSDNFFYGTGSDLMTFYTFERVRLGLVHARDGYLGEHPVGTATGGVPVLYSIWSLNARVLDTRGEAIIPWFKSCLLRGPALLLRAYAE